ncbi:MAG: hypothetical protein ACT4P6_00255 [Gemmatimonadaceae bacterium]
MAWQDDVERLIRDRWKPGERFTLTEVYTFVPELEQLHPGNRFVHARVRDALQGLRQRRVVEFVTRGRYRLR